MEYPHLVNEIYKFFLDIFFPKKCLICGKYGADFCFDCSLLIEEVKTFLCPECGKITENGQYCIACKGKIKPSLSAILIASRYNVGPTKKLISYFKYEGFVGLALPLAELIVSQIKKANVGLNNTIIVPVPLYIGRKNRRGFNQSELLARHISKRLSLPGGEVLERTKDTTPQVSLTRANRLSNIENAFVCADPDLIAGKTVILIDDVMTTGATLNECAKVLKKSGTKKVIGAVIARNI